MIDLAKAIENKANELGITDVSRRVLVEVDDTGAVCGACIIGLAALAVGITPEEIRAASFEPNGDDDDGGWNNITKGTSWAALEIDRRLGCDIMTAPDPSKPKTWQSSFVDRPTYEPTFEVAYGWNDSGNKNLTGLIEYIGERQADICPPDNVP